VPIPLILRLRAWFRSPSPASVNLSRRRLMMTGLAGVAAGILAKAGSLPDQKGFRQGLLRPPGACGEDRFLEECLRCGLCVWNCPTGVIQPAFLEAGSAGVFTPVMKMEVGHCAYCAGCSVCPKGIVRMRGYRAKPEYRRQYRIGLAVIDRVICRSYADGATCTVCRDACAQLEKAIALKPSTRTDGHLVEEPSVNQDLCVGCGRCEHLCPARPRRAIRVLSAGESRHPANRPSAQNLM
jgi:formate hydrogenlyase subunit 6/NADH:ubiquinone oxidoreductase subunit I